MTSNEVKEMCKKMGVIFDEDHPDHITASKLKTLTPPFMEYILTDKPIHADGKRYIDIKEMEIRIYSDTEVSEAEENVQRVLEEEDLRWKRSSEYIDELLLWAIIYKLEV
ncbi:hypothetical protein C817_02574 [Dorea sp. 5-2]|nr:hypothetical protein C817_02574 [Dorea sp. 5-2]